MFAEPSHLVTLTSDFGTRDFYVAAMKAAVIRHATPDARLIDITHEVPRHDVLFGSITLERAIDSFPAGTVHLAVVDPGVGTERRILVAAIHRQAIVCPDNGLITWAWRRLGPGEVYEMSWRPKLFSDTFHGRDLMAPVAGMLAAGVEVPEVAMPIDNPVLLDIAPAEPGSRSARIIHIDAFGNATTNMDRATLRASGARTFSVARRDIGPLRRTYGEVPPGEPLALIGSSGLLEIAVREGSAQEQLGLHVGDEVMLT